MTAQTCEKLILDGVETSMACCPPLPDGHPRIYEPSSEIDYIDSSCWRGYIGTWEIKYGRFYLVDLCGRLTLREGEPIFAEWFSGVLHVPKGDLLHYVHQGFLSVYEQELRIKIENGVVVDTQIIDNRNQT
jgi:hypothetical protein